MSIEFYTYDDNGKRRQRNPDFFLFPAGEWEMNTDQLSEEVIGIVKRTEVVIRTTNVNALVQAGLWANYWGSRDVGSELYIPYMPASRADHGGTEGVNVYEALIDSLSFSSVTTLDIHSNVLKDQGSFMSFSTAEYATLAAVSQLDYGYDAVIAPDEGAKRRAARVAHKLGIPLLVARKVRDNVGNIVAYDIDGIEETHSYLVVDDICDGGATFIKLAETMDVEEAGLDLWVTHGFFSKGLDELKRHYDKIMTTDSVFRGNSSLEWQLTVVPCLPYMR